MQQTIQIKRSSAQVVLSNLERTVKNCKEWLNAKSESFSLIMEESITRIQVLRFYLFLLSLFIVIGTIETMPFITAIAMACTAYLVYRMNVADSENNEKAARKDR